MSGGYFFNLNLSLFKRIKDRTFKVQFNNGGAVQRSNVDFVVILLQW